LHVWVTLTQIPENFLAIIHLFSKEKKLECHRDNWCLQRRHVVRNCHTFLKQRPHILLRGFGDCCKHIIFGKSPRCTARQRRNPRNPVSISFLGLLDRKDITVASKIFSMGT